MPMRTDLRRVASGLCLLAGALSAMLASAARSDFVFRGCPGIPRAEWEATANCADGRFGQVLFALGTVLCLGLAIAVWPRRRTA